MLSAIVGTCAQRAEDHKVRVNEADKPSELVQEQWPLAACDE